jgi:hypothetical protein
MALKTIGGPPKSESAPRSCLMKISLNIIGLEVIVGGGSEPPAFPKAKCGSDRCSRSLIVTD